MTVREFFKKYSPIKERAKKNRSSTKIYDLEDMIDFAESYHKIKRDPYIFVMVGIIILALVTVFVTIIH